MYKKKVTKLRQVSLDAMPMISPQQASDFSVQICLDIFIGRLSFDLLFGTTLFEDAGYTVCVTGSEGKTLTFSNRR